MSYFDTNFLLFFHFFLSAYRSALLISTAVRSMFRSKVPRLLTILLSFLPAAAAAAVAGKRPTGNDAVLPPAAAVAGAAAAAAAAVAALPAFFVALLFSFKGSLAQS